MFNVKSFERCKDKKIEKSLNIWANIIDIEGKKMKVIQIGNSRYYVQDEDDLISLVHQLVQKGYSVNQITSLLNISERKIKKYLEDCW
jgi:hypothetical protein